MDDSSSSRVISRSVCTFACLLLLFEVDEQETGALRTEGQQDALQHSRGHSEGQQQGPQFVRAQQSLQTKDLNTRNHNSRLIYNNTH